MELAGITASVVIGAGFATGREIRTYFTKYGNLSYFIIAGVAVLLYLGMLLLLRSGHRCPGGKIVAVPYVFFGYILMLAGLGQLVEDYTIFSRFVGIAAGVLMTVLGLLAGFGRFTVFSGVLSPCIALVLVVMTVWTGVRSHAYNFAAASFLEVSSSMVKFVGYNFLSGLIVLPEIGEGYTKKQKFWGVGIGVLGLTICMVFINWCFLKNYVAVEAWEMPLIQLISAGGNSALGMMAVSLLCLVMVLSLCGSAVGISRMVAHGKREFFAGMIFTIIAVPLSMFGFGALMDNVYPLFGLIGAGLMLWYAHTIRTGVCPPSLLLML